MDTLLSISPLSSIATVNAYLTAFAEKNIEVALQYVSDDAIWHVDGDPVLKTVGIVQGKDAIRLWLTRFPEGFIPLDVKLEPLIDVTPDVIAIGHFRHRVVSTNAIADGDFMIRFTTSNGQITRYQIFEDSLMLSKAHHSQWPQRSARVNGVQYGWDDHGEGPTLVFLHGLFLDRTFWSPVIKRLSKPFRCVVFDMPGHGASGWREGLDLNAIANDIALWLIENNISKVTLVGHSQGGMIALRIAAKYPQLLNKLVLVNTSTRAEAPSHMPLWQQRRSLLLSLDEKNRQSVFEDIQKIKYTSSWLQAHPAYARDDINKQMKANPRMLAYAMDAAVIEREDIREILKEITVNTIVLAGTEDIATPSAHGEEIARLMPNATYSAVKKASHSIPVEMPEALVECF
ncbi:alpha/beta fold hydrolase [Shewanella sp. VB17]|uniref:alpha/beta fold hydrolase n=1 Tax=Shewanella sp. VB17 TaxID=2739432 RepID=UPI001567828A|nr:alpha/beta fold hydrolase [Shewanella sp. VB17]NRD74484.1 alpha/beta fold hydrolase [Shewanella sp. VB17]